MTKKRKVPAVCSFKNIATYLGIDEEVVRLAKESGTFDNTDFKSVMDFIRGSATPETQPIIEAVMVTPTPDYPKPTRTPIDPIADDPYLKRAMALKFKPPHPSKS